MVLKTSIMTRVFWDCYKWPGRTFNYTLVQILRRIAKCGLDFVDLCEFPLEFWPLHLTQDDARNLKDTLKALNLRVSGITVPTFAPGLELLPTKEDRSIIVKRLKRAIELVSHLGGNTVMYGICPREMYGSTREETYKWTVETFTECISLAEDRRVSIAVEFVNTCFPTTQSIIRFLDKVDSQNVGVCLEVGAVQARPKQETVIEHLVECGQRIKLVHLVDPANTEWLGSIGVDLLEVVGALENLEYEGHFVIEGFRRSIPCSELDVEVAKAVECLKGEARSASSLSSKC